MMSITSTAGTLLCPPPVSRGGWRGGRYAVRAQEKTSFLHGLADHKDQFGAPLCPCRHYDDKAAEAAQDFWNCPCVPMRESLTFLKENHCIYSVTFSGFFIFFKLPSLLKESKSKY
ncbi:hypothetical protein ZWY2020_056683 [Hordeum vulgare]|nr:hypothetical protein ZWY2020_056683 [Hordeum vulgare]